jgi:4-amino-4-deoxy-L-arabinose transferase-like glycosyltransferase
MYPPSQLSKSLGTPRRETFWVAAILAVGLAVRFWLVPHRWINPDEGAHLMDGRLALDGLVPFVGYDARQVLYAYVMAALLAIWGKSYLAVRACVAVLNVGIGLMIYLIARRLWDGRVGVVATLIYVSLPFAVSWSATVHTEPFTTLLCCLAMFALVRRHPRPPDTLGLIGAGVCLALAFYVRESSLGVLFGALVYLFVMRRHEPPALVRRGMLLGIGFLIPCAVIGLFYSRYMSAAEWLASPLDPLTIVVRNLGTVVPPGPGAHVVGPTPSRPTTLPTAMTLDYLRTVAAMNAGLLLALALALALPLVTRGQPPKSVPRDRGSLVMLGCWVGGLALVYAYWTLHRGFFPQYAEEFLPALSMVLAFVLLELLAAWGAERHTGLALGLIATYLAIAVGVAEAFPAFEPPTYGYFVVPALVLALWQVPGEGPARWRAWGILAGSVAFLALLGSGAVGAPHLVRVLLKALMAPLLLIELYLIGKRQAASPSLGAFATLCVLLTVLGVAYMAAGRLLDRRYQAVWAPETVASTSSYLREHSSPDDRMISGAMIWELQSDRRPFENVSHPLAFMLGVHPTESAALTQRLKAAPPRFVVLDGYTEQTYGVAVPLTDVLAERYVLDTTVTGSDFPVRVYRRVR